MSEPTAFVRPWGSDALVAHAPAAADVPADGSTLAIPTARAARLVGAPPMTDLASVCAFDETHSVAVVHPRWDGFLVTEFVALADVTDLRFAVSESLAETVTPHYHAAPLRRGQVRPVDLELHPGTIPWRGVSGTITACDGDEPIAGQPLRMTIFASRSATCSTAGAVAGPLRRGTLERTVKLTRQGLFPATALAARIERAERSRKPVSGDPWWELAEDDG